VADVEPGTYTVTIQYDSDLMEVYSKPTKVTVGG
jgi:hypothetical protein